MTTEVSDIFDLIYTTTATTCGAMCWYAKEDTCRCSCSGENHGALLKDGAEQPARTRKVGPYRYTLIAVGLRGDKGLTEIKEAAYESLTGEKPRAWHGYKLYPSYGAPSPVGVEEASKGQAKWPEVATVAPEFAKVATDPDAKPWIWQRHPERPILVWKQTASGLET